MYHVIAFYKFVAIDNVERLQLELKALTVKLGLKGSILVAHEGVNSTLAGLAEAVAQFKSWMHAKDEFTDLIFKTSYAEIMPFKRMLVKIKPEIVTMRCSNIDPTSETGYYLDPLLFKQWQDTQEEMLIVDTRNDYEVALGTFENAIDPRIKTFSQFPGWVKEHLKDYKQKKIVTFCTGGIRCEKATAFMKKEGFEQVYQIDGGILNYFEKTLNCADTNHWKGECVVFDHRQAVDKHLNPTHQEICFVCYTGLNDANKAQKTYKEGCCACKACAELMDSCREKKMTQNQKKAKV